jgi:hypothetical protein
MHINSLFSLLLINILFGSIDEPKKKNIIKKQLNSNQVNKRHSILTDSRQNHFTSFYDDLLLTSYTCCSTVHRDLSIAIKLNQTKKNK